MYAYSVFLADVDIYGIYFHDLWEKMQDIRSKAEYKGKYAYRGADQNCLFVPPEVDPTGVGMTMSALREPELVTSENIDSLSGVFAEVIGAVAVSYTHLDVYKRQGAACGKNRSQHRDDFQY